jgi:hypothetical protein
MGNIDKRLSALEGGASGRDLVQIQMSAVEPLTLEEARERAQVPWKPGEVITRVELVPILPTAEILPIRPNGVS